MKRYRVEVKIDKNNCFRVDCDESEFEYYKALCKYDAIKNGGDCYYREFPLTKNKKVFYSNGSKNMTLTELNLIKKINELNHKNKLDNI